MRTPTWLALPGAAALLLATQACNGGGAVPAAPTGVQAAVQAGAMHLTWTAAGSGQTEFVIGRAVVGAAASRPAQTEYVVIGSTSGSGSAFDDPDVQPGHYYFYGVAARSAAGRSPFTAQGGDALSLTAMTGSCAGPITSTDSDGDGVSDADENAGWTVLVDEDGTGTSSSRLVKSDPFSPDTDGDGLCDGEERSLKTDPRQADTDGDGLTDYQEVNRWGSSPTNVDSDGDAHGNPAFYDGSELFNHGTSPTLADTDGDGRSDFDEVNQNGTNALVAELPEPRLNVVSAMDLGVNIQTSTGSTVSNAFTHTFEQGTASSLTRTSSTANTTSTEQSYSITAEESAGFPESASVKVTGTYSAKEGFVQETSSSFSRESQQSATTTYDALTSELVSKDETVTGGHLALDFEIQNQGTRSFQIGSVVVTALRRDRTNPATFTSVATLAFPTTADSLVLAEGQSTGHLRAQADIAGNVALDLLANPGDLFFRAANFNLTDRTGAAFQFSVGETTNARTALLTIDYGGVRPLERYRVATNVERTSTGKAAGVRLGDALQRMLGLAPGAGYATAPRGGPDGGQRIFTRIRDVATTASPDGGTERFWVVMAPENPDSTLTTVSDRILSRGKDVEDVVLMPRDQVTLAFVADRDGDGLFEREEAAHGTYDGVADSDGDGLSDFEEVRVGWVVPVDNAFYRANPRVYSNPTAADADGDGWTDAEEKAHGTDPNRKDTDGDGLIDSLDPAPTQGPTGSWSRMLGTTGEEVAYQVLADTSTVWVLGSSTGDLDKDGVAGGPFLMALAADAGTPLWTVQLEGSTNFSRKATLALDGTVTWLTEVKPGVLPGVVSDAIYLVRFGRDGGVRSVLNQTDVPYNAATTLSNTTLGSQEPSPSGGPLLFSALRQANNQYAVELTAFDAIGGFAAGTGLSSTFGTNPPTVVSTASSGLLSALTVSWAAGCQLWVYRGAASQPGGATYCNSAVPLFAGQLGKVALDTQTAAYLQVNTGTFDRLDRLTLGGSILWSRTWGSELTTPRITALDVDAVDQVYVGLHGTGQPAALDILRGDQSRIAELHLGDDSTRLTSSRRDGVGNLYVAGNSIGGFPAPVGPTAGGNDLVIFRNPQLLGP